MTDRALCPDDRLSSLIAALGTDRSPRELDAALASFPGDPRLHFLRGSMLAAAEDYSAARAAMRRALDLAPDYAVARFQLGLLQLTSGDAIAAQETWGPLHGLPPDNHLRIFAGGLIHLIGGRFGEAVEELERGIALNRENAPMNGDMRRVIDAIRARGEGADDGAFSPVEVLLRQSALKITRH